MMPVFENVWRNLPHFLPSLDGSPTASAIVTPTVVQEATPVPTAPVAVPTAEPVAVVSTWNPSQWLDVPAAWTSDFHTPFLVFFVLLAIAAVVAYFVFFQRIYKDHKLKAHLAERLSIYLTVFATVGLLLLVFSVARTPLLSLPLWLVLSMIAFIAFVVFCVYYYISIYPSALVKYQHDLERERYIPKGRTKGPAYTPPMKKKQKQTKQAKKK